MVVTHRHSEWYTHIVPHLTSESHSAANSVESPSLLKCHHFRIFSFISGFFFVRCLALSFEIPTAVGSKSEGKAGRGRSTRPSLFLLSQYRIFYHYLAMYRKLLLFYYDYRIYDDRWQIKLSPSLLLLLF